MKNNFINETIIALTLVASIWTGNGLNSSDINWQGINSDNNHILKQKGCLNTSFDGSETTMNRFVDNSGNIPQIFSENYTPKGLLEAAREIFPETRNLTKDELQAYNAVWDEMSQDLEFSFFDVVG